MSSPVPQPPFCNKRNVACKKLCYRKEEASASSAEKTKLSNVFLLHSFCTLFSRFPILLYLRHRTIKTAIVRTNAQNEQKTRKRISFKFLIAPHITFQFSFPLSEIFPLLRPKPTNQEMHNG